jgi:cell division protein FtsL
MTAPWRARTAPLPELEPRRGDRRRHLQVVPDPGEQRARRLSNLFTGLIFVVACFGLFAVIGAHVLLAQGQAEVQELQDRAAEERERLADLRLEVAALEAPAHIIDAARARGMVAPETVVSLAPATLADPPSTTIPSPSDAAVRSGAQAGSTAAASPSNGSARP